MGAALTTQNAKSNLELRKRIDYIVKNLIFDSDFTDMTKLGNEKYCNRLVKKVSDIFNKNKDSIDIVLLRKKLYEMKKNNPPELELDENENKFKFETTENDKRNDVQKDRQDKQKESSRYIKQEEQQEQEQEEQQEEQIKGGENRSTTRSRSPTTRKRMPSTTRPQNIKKKCNEIAKFYVLFAHLFSSIVSTINPSFEIDASSSSSSSDKKNTGSGPLDFCSSRLNSLINGELIENSEGDVTIRPNVCKTNLSESGSALRLVDLPGIKALLKLFKNGGDDSLEDVKYLYKVFTGKDAPSDINIEHIPLHVFSKDVECSGSGSSGSSSRSESRGGANEPYAFDDNDYRRYRDREEREIRNLNVDVRSGVYLSGVKGSPTKEKLFSDYIKNIKIMIQKSENNRSLLLEILSEMFTYTYDSDDEISGVIINPSLTFKELETLVKRTRKIIIKLYTECEEDYNTGLDIFFALIQEKILSKLLLQDDALLQDFALRRRLNEYMIPNNLERSVAFNPYQQNPYQPNVNKNQFIPPHFKQDVYKEVKRLLYENDWTYDYFPSIKSDLDEWIEDEKNRVSGPNMLDPLIVAKEFFDSKTDTDFYKEYEEDEENGAAAAAIDVPAVVSGAPSSAPVVSGSTPPASARPPVATVSGSPVSGSPPSASAVLPVSPAPGSVTPAPGSVTPARPRPRIPFSPIRRPF